MINVWYFLIFVALGVCKSKAVCQFNKYRIFDDAMIQNISGSTETESVVGCNQLDHTRSAPIITYDATLQLCHLYDENAYPLMISPAPSTPRTIYVKGTIYSLVQTPMHWIDAQLNCEVNGGHLMKIESAEENELVSPWLTMYGHNSDPSSEYGPWIGLNDRALERQWLWADDTSLGDYVNWEFENPNNANGTGTGADCVCMSYPNYRWDDKPCLSELWSICEYN